MKKITSAPATVSREDWLAAVQELHGLEPLSDDPNTLTSTEFADLSHVAQSTARRQLMELVKRGRAERVSKLVQTPSGPRRCSAFRLIKKESA